MLQSPPLLSAGLALSAAGFVSRGLSEVDGVNISRVMGHLQSSGLALLRTALAQGHKDETLLATCLIWCLAEVFAGRQEICSWRIHLQGIKALLEDHQEYRFTTSSPTSTQSAMRHLILLYRSLQTLPYLPTIPLPDSSSQVIKAATTGPHRALAVGATIDGFLGYSEELLDLLQEINETPQSAQEANHVLVKLLGMIDRDAQAPPGVSISSSLSPQSGRDFALCHRIFQHASLVQLYRQLYKLPSCSQQIQDAVEAIQGMINNMTQGQPCNTWVAMAMPLFTIGCEAFRDDQKAFVLDKIHKFGVCLGSLHVQIIRRALEDVWRIRADHRDMDGELCAAHLLGK
ncbi:hypothetical protein FZEAL_259 [Fusarium zealandicum]|uniref:Uncharacterized protein n=1 Tax=Fusarium zealandicum TaxID=1053134 RepID=A0A8H4XQ02_9HYPO|nr:hypothetical protein FZEAL_259 [Fusarium zealandicum]